MQTKIKVLRKIILLFANKNKELQNINDTARKQWFCNTYFPWSYLQFYLQHWFYFARQSSLSLRCSFSCALHFSARLALWRCFDVGVESRGRGVYNMPPWKWRHRPETQLTDPGTVMMSRCMRVDRFLLFTSIKTCMVSFY